MPVLAVTAPSNSSTTASGRVARIFRHSAICVALASGVGTLVLAGISLMGMVPFPGGLFSLGETLGVSITSGLIGILGMIPGWVIGRTAGIQRAGESSVALIGVVAAMAIRFSGTVALFVVCRYHFGEESQSVAFLVILWYLSLTSIEVFSLARGIMSLDQNTI